MYYTKENSTVATRKLITISLPPPLLKQAEQLAREERRTKSELLREAFRFYVETRAVRRAAMRERALAVIDAVHARTKGVSANEIRTIVRQAVAAARSTKRRASA
jgi:metal-responsive CopG/Arc/MetJ family transcriptional regulator